MPIGQRKISTSDITLSTAPQTVVESNNAEFNGLSDELTKFMQEGQLSGKGWESAKKLAGVYETITHTFQMVSDQLMQANAEVKNTSGLIGTQIDEAAIEDQISNNKAAMTTLSYSNTIWNSTNPGVVNQDTSMATANNNYIASLTNQNNELQKVIDGLNGYDSRTKSVYDEALDSLNKLESLMKQVSDSSKIYNAKTGLFTTDGIDMNIVKELDKKYEDTQITTDPTEQAKGLLDLYEHMEGYNHDLADKVAKLIAAGNPAGALEKLLEQENFVNAMLYNNSPFITKSFLKIVTGLELSEDLMAKISKTSAKGFVEKIFNSSVYAKFVDKLPLYIQEKQLNSLIKLEQGGWNILAPLGHFSEVLSKFGLTKGAVAILEKLKSMDKFAKFLKVAGPILSAANISTNVLDEFCNPDSEAYGDIDKAIYGGIIKYIVDTGPLEGGEYGSILGGPIGGGIGLSVGLINSVVQMSGIKSEKDIMKWAYQQYDKEKADKRSLEEKILDGPMGH